MESRTEFSFWSLWASPLIFATDPRGMSDSKRSILLNVEAIAVNQDALSLGGGRLSSNETSGAQVWSKPLSGGEVAVLLYNRGSYDDDTWGGGGAGVGVGFTWAQLGWGAGVVGPGGGYDVAMRDLWAHAAAAASDPDTGHTAVLDPRDVQFLRLKLVPKGTR